MLYNDIMNSNNKLY